MKRALLTLNAGSSSIKFALFELSAATPALLYRGAVTGIGTAPRLAVHDPKGAIVTEQAWADGAAMQHEDLLRPVLDWINTHLGDEALVAVGHRVVHGGTTFGRPLQVDEPVLARLQALVPLAPLHQPHNLAAIRAMQRLCPGLPQVACFDTAFHRSMSATAMRLALPRAFAAEGVRRYGFHGLSYEYLAGRLRTIAPAVAGGSVVAAHLGNGASLCAMRNGRSVDTTMGFTALDGLVMGTRCGSLDPGAVLYLQQAHGLSAAQVERMLYHDSGLLGVSGVSNDMRTLLDSRDPWAWEAVELFVHRVVRETGAMAAVLGGFDALVFSAGIGENSAAIRALVCTRLAWLGVELDTAANTAHATVISTPASRVRVFVIPTDEEAMIAAHTAAVWRAGAMPPSAAELAQTR